ncbi:MAG: tRNA (N(6)-L-threonylcarbamoyladenosine(37)-C(2))-methylthiotransferase MtaB [Alphaproteobacteria bacterium]
MSKKDKSEPEIKTFGCRLNFYESEVIRAHALEAGLGDDVIIFNTCAVTKEAERQARQAIRRAKRDNPDATLIVTGCSAQITPEIYKDIAEVDRVIGNDFKLEAKSWQNRCGDEKVLVNEVMSFDDNDSPLIEGYEDRSRAFLQVQNGCDNRCTFCIIPYGRGDARSVPVAQIARQVKNLAKGGYNEIILTGVDVTSYGADLPERPALGTMIRQVLDLVPELKRLRLSSLDPAAIDEDLWHLIAHEPRLCPHLHLSVQAGDDLILKRMKRRHLRGDVIALCQRARDIRPDVVFGADLIAGFPTETEKMFVNTVRFVEECDLTFLHVFPYSEREGTPAARIPNKVPVAQRKERAARLRALGEAQLEKLLQRSIDKDFDVIVEQDGAGKTETFLSVRLEGEYVSGQLIRFRATGIQDGMLSGTVLS